jgi:uncharacterized membrane protein/Mg-chelatase subunit ChlD
MGNYQLDFGSPWYLLLLLLAPLLWVLSFRSLSGLGNWRRLIVLGLRTTIYVLFVLAVAEIQFVRATDRVEVYYLLDQSRSIPASHRELMLDFVRQAVHKHRRTEDRAGVIVFGREANIEVPAFDDELQLGANVESLLDPDHTNLASAMKLAQASFHEDAARRVVVVTDGNENMGDALEQAQGLRDAGISIDVVPIRYTNRAEVLVEKVAMPSDVRRGQPFDLRVVVTNLAEPTADDPGNVTGELIIRQKTDDQPIVLSQERMTLSPGKHVFTIRQTIDEPAFYTYEAVFVPDDPNDDGLPQNNQAAAHTHIRGAGQVLLLEYSGSEELEEEGNEGEHAFFVSRLRANNLEVTVRPTSQMFTSLAELQPYDTVILADVPRAAFSDEQIQMLVHNVEFMGAGLIMLGGESSFGAGGWTNTELEKAMPVDFQIKSAKVVPKGALAIIFHASELAEGNFWQKKVGEEALKALGSQDYCGALAWDGSERWLWGHPNGMRKVGGNRDLMLSRIDTMVPGDMPDFDPTMRMARAGLVKLKDAAVKHMIIISDGDPSPTSRGVLQSLVDAKITCSTVAVGTHGAPGSNELRRIASRTGGKYYVVNNSKALPRIFQREARRVARPLIYTNEDGIVPQVASFHEILTGIEEPLPPITAYVMTSRKENSLVETALLSPLPPSQNFDNNTLLATWTYGLGRTVAFTTDTGGRWANAWTNWSGYDKFFTTLVRFSMRPTGDTGKYTVAMDREGDKTQVVITALDQDDQFLNFLDIGGAVIGPNGERISLDLEQTAPGRYVGEFESRDAGSYFVSLVPGPGQAPILTGLDVPYSAEFRERGTNENLLATLAALKPEGGAAGKLLDSPQTAADLDRLLGEDPFRRDLPKATSSQDAWFVLAVIAGVLFLLDVFFRRVTVSLAWLPPLALRLWNRLLGREMAPAPVEYIQRLRSRKAEVTEGIEQRKAATRFEPEPDVLSKTPTLAEQLAAPPPLPGTGAPQKPTAGLTPEQEEESYTSRLMKAKKKALDERKGP